MISTPITKAKILKDIEELYQHALGCQNFHAALRAKWMQGKAIGLFTPPSLPDVVRIKDMNPEQLQEFIAILEENEPAVQDLKRLEEARKQGLETKNEDNRHF